MIDRFSSLSKLGLLIFFLCGFSMITSAQEVAIKTNLLYDAATTPNLGVEIGTAPKQTLQLTYGWNPWKFGHNKQLRHWTLSPEYRWWFCHRFNGHFLGAHALGGQFNVGGVKLPMGIWKALRDHRYQGWMVGGGVTYGYQWIFSKHWNLEASLGVGYLRINYKKFVCADCGEQLAHKKRNYVGPTKAAVSLIYLF